MPCYTPPPTYEEELASWTERLSHDSPTAEILCEVMQLADDRGETARMPIKAVLWWAEHKRRDTERLQKERDALKTEEDKKAALEKLSPYERKLLRL